MHETKVLQIILGYLKGGKKKPIHIGAQRNIRPKRTNVFLCVDFLKLNDGNDSFQKNVIF